MATFNPSWDFSDWTVGRDGSARIRGYVHFDPTTEDESHIETAAAGGLPASYGGFWLNSIVLRPHSWDVFEAVGRYSPLPVPDTTGATPPEFSFEVATESVKALHNLATVSQGAVSGRNAPDHGGLVNVDRDGKVQGVDIPQAVYAFSEIHHFANAAITTAYKVNLANLVGRVNLGPFRGFAAGEVLCTGVSGSVRGIDLWTLRFSWSVSPNVSGLTVGPLTNITKRGWDYLEIHVEEQEDTGQKVVLQKPYAYTVHQVLRYGNYALFGIGT